MCIRFCVESIATAVSSDNGGCQKKALCKQQHRTCIEYNFTSIIRNWQFNWPFALVGESILHSRKGLHRTNHSLSQKATYRKMIPLYSDISYFLYRVIYIYVSNYFKDIFCFTANTTIFFSIQHHRPSMAFKIQLWNRKKFTRS